MRDWCDIGGGMEAYTERLVVARKEHRCCETGAVIRSGTHYWLCKGLYDGRWWTYHQSWAAYRLARSLNFEASAEHACWIPFCGLHAEEEIDRAEWEAVCRGEITRPPVGDEEARLREWGVPLPPVVEVLSVEVADA